MVQARQPDHRVGRVAAPLSEPLSSAAPGSSSEDGHQRQFLAHEAEALLTRLAQVMPFDTTMPMVVAAAISPKAQKSLHQLIRAGRQQLDRRVRQFIRGVKTNRAEPLHRLQSAYSVLKLQFNALLDQFDIFADVINQRSEHHTGVWLAGLDILARDVLRLEGDFYQSPPMICYLDRGHGAAIRRARTRLPGGEENPVAVIKVPRERMVGSGIGSSLVHEVGHQGAALLDLIASLKPIFDKKAAQEPQRARAWQLYSLWISEILSDFWSAATLGISASTGLISVVSLPTYFVFRMPDDDPHPYPWIRVKISIAFGRALYPDPQWDGLERTWERLYPTEGQPAAQRDLIRLLSGTLPDFVQTVIQHRPAALRGKRLLDAFPLAERQPAQLRHLYLAWQQEPKAMFRARPGLLFAVIGQARADFALSPARENKTLTEMLYQWAIMQQQQSV